MHDPCHSLVANAELSKILALETVPPSTTTRWNARRKAQVVRAVQARLLTEDEACRFYNMTAEELAAWQRGLAEAGEGGLKATKRIRPRWADQLDGGWGLQKSQFARRYDPYGRAG